MYCSPCPGQLHVRLDEKFLACLAAQENRQERREMRRIGTALLLAAGLIASFRPAAAQGTGASAEPVSAFGDVVEVRVVNLEVVVTDAEGRRVPDLKRGDFRLLV